MHHKNLLHSILVGIILLSCCGCELLIFGAGGGTGAGTVAYAKGRLKSTEEASLDKTWEAAQKAMDDLEFVATSKQKDALSAKLIARGANDKKVEIDLTKVSENSTEIKIRVGIFGDESASRLILDKLKKHL